MQHYKYNTSKKNVGDGGTSLTTTHDARCDVNIITDQCMLPVVACCCLLLVS